MLIQLQAKFGRAEDLVQFAVVTADDCGEGYSKCRYAIGDPDCRGCKGAMFG